MSFPQSRKTLGAGISIFLLILLAGCISSPPAQNNLPVPMPAASLTDCSPLSGPAENLKATPFSDPNTPLMFSYPEGWQYEIFLGNVRFQDFGEDNTFLELGVDDFSKNRTLENFEASQLKILNNDPWVANIEICKTSQAGVPAHRATYKQLDLDADRHGEFDSLAMEEWFEKDGKVYHLSYHALTNAYPKYLPEVNAVLNSFENQ